MLDQEILKKRMSFIKTICFFDCFDFALTNEEICEYMLYKKWSYDELYNFINHEEFVIENNCHVYLKGRFLTVDVRTDMEHRAKKLIRKAQKFIKYMQLLPFIRMIGICNSLAFYDADKGSDIDIFIITEKNRLFTARLFAFIFTQFLGIRRHGRKIKGRFCLSFWVSRDNMNLETLKLNTDDIYFIYWIRLMQPIIGKKTYMDFLNENAWIHNYFEYEFEQNKFILPESGVIIRLQKLFEFPLKGIIGNFIENIIGKLQKRRSERKAKKLESRSGILITDTILKFHDIDMRERYSFLWKKRINQFEKYFIPGVRGSEKQGLSLYPKIDTASVFHSQDSAYMKNGAH
ncbi:hypothetical protein JW911_00680 [Candidatus Peregrinibacteria bacterium]|nr:hypothetical protein [Candidatus Peregrinibacteria bacterium]